MPTHNEDIARIFDEIADLLEIEQANPFRIRAYRNAARSIRGLGRELADLVADQQDLTELPGIGADLAKKIREILATGTAQALEDLRSRVPAGLEELLKLPGLGPRRVRRLYEDLDIKGIDALEQAARAGRISELDGFGKRTEAKILDAIAARRARQHRHLRSVAAAYAEPLCAWLTETPGVGEVVVAGSYRRGQETVGDLDILVTAGDPAAVIERFASYDEVREIVSKGTTRATVYLGGAGLQVDLRVVAPESFGAALQYFTGSKAHNIEIRRRAQARGLKVNEYGVFRGARRVSGKTEREVYRAVKLPWIPPELRENRGEIEAAEQDRLPQLVELADLRGDLHLHTHATDGRASIEEMAAAAGDFGLEYIAITDHSRAVRIANGLDARRLQEQIDAIDRFNATGARVTVLKGIEVDILEDGRLDLPDKLLDLLDIVVASVHSHFALSRKKQTERILRALDNPCVAILGHPSGRLLEQRDAYDVDMERVIEGARERGVALELNSQPQRLDLTDVWCRAAKDAGVAVAINSDSHSTGGFANLRFGIAQARRGWLEKKHVLNARTLRSLRNWLRAARGR